MLSSYDAKNGRSGDDPCFDANQPGDQNYWGQRAQHDRCDEQGFRDRREIFSDQTRYRWKVVKGDPTDPRRSLGKLVRSLGPIAERHQNSSYKVLVRSPLSRDNVPLSNQEWDATQSSRLLLLDWTHLNDFPPSF
jgi:hypothetical protein